MDDLQFYVLFNSISVYHGDGWVIMKGRMDRWMDNWMTCDFTSLSTVFQSYQDDERLIMKGCVQWNSIYN